MNKELISKVISYNYNEFGKEFGDCIVDMKNEIERLKEMKLHTEKYASEMEDKYILEKNKNNKAIEYAEDEIESAKGCIYRELPEEIYIECWKEILDILRGEDNEN